jgi:nucleotide-binding universal stress UspA family protein
MRILLATDGHPESAGAIRLAGTLAADEGASVSVIRALEPIPVYGPASTHLLWFPEPTRNDEWREGVADEVRNLLSQEAGGVVDWPVNVEVGPVPVTIARAADRQAATLLVLGSGRHDRIDRWFGTETALRVTQLSSVPVVAVPQNGGVRPRVLVAAVDFSDFARDALHAALDIAGTEPVVHLLHVLPSPHDFSSFYGTEWTEDYRDRARDQLDAWGAELEAPSGTRIESHVLEGRVANAILDHAESVGAELLVAGSHGMGFVGRLVLGSVSTRLIRGAGCAVLIAPPREKARELVDAVRDH